MTVAQIARLHGPECIELWLKAMGDEKAPWNARIRAAELVMERGHGKAISVVDMQVTHHRPLVTLSTEELEAIAAGEIPELPITIDGEAVTVPQTVPQLPEAVC